jgi:hypothetical protein
MVDVFERKSLRRIYGPIKGRDQWRCRFNKELYDLFKEPRLSVVIRIARLRWVGHVARMDENCMPRRLMYVQPEGLRKVGRQHTRWRDEVGKDARMLRLRSWRVTAMNREEWRKLLKETKTVRVVVPMMMMMMIIIQSAFKGGLVYTFSKKKFISGL